MKKTPQYFFKGKDNVNWLEMMRFFRYVQVQVEENTDIHLDFAAGGRHTGLAGLAKAFNGFCPTG